MCIYIQLMPKSYSYNLIILYIRDNFISVNSLESAMIWEDEYSEGKYLFK